MLIVKPINVIKKTVSFYNDELIPIDLVQERFLIIKLVL